MTWIPVALLAVLPGLCPAARAGWLRSRVRRWTLAAFAIVATAVALSWQGVDFDPLKNVSMLLSAAAAILFLVHRLRPLSRHRLGGSLLVPAATS